MLISRLLKKNVVMMRKWTLLIITLAAIVNAYANGFIHFNPFSGSERVGKALVTTDGLYWIGYTTAYGTDDILVIKYDTLGNIVWSKTYDFGNDERAISAIEHPSGGIVIAGEARNIRDGVAMHIDPNGNLQWSRLVIGNSLAFYDVEYDPVNNRLWFVGSYRPGGAGWEIAIYITDLNGNNPITLQYGDLGSNGTDEFGFGIKFNPVTGQMVVVGSTDDGADFDFLIVRIDVNNATSNFWADYILLPIDDDFANDVEISPSGDIIIGGESNFQGSGVNQATVASVNSNVSSLMWISSYVTPGGSNVSSIKEYNGAIYVGGETNYNGNQDAMILELNSNGNIISQYAVGKQANEIGAIDVMPSGQIFVSMETDEIDGGNDPMVALIPLSRTLRCGISQLGHTQYSYATANISPHNNFGVDFFSPNLNPQNYSLQFSFEGPVNYACYCPITADFGTTADPYVCTGTSVDFNYIGDTLGVLNYMWSFGDGATPATSTLRDPAGVVYATAGSKSVTLTVSDAACQATVTKAVTVHETPAVSFTVSNTQPCEGEPVNFTNTGSSGAGWSFSWDFDVDAVPQTSSDENPAGVYWTSPGPKDVVLTISSDYCSNSATATVTVQDKPVVDFVVPVRICQGDTAEFMFTGQALAGATYMWTMEGGIPGSASTRDAWTIYGPVGWQDVKLVVTNTNGCVDSVVKQVLVDSTPGVSFTSTAPVCAGSFVDFTNTGTRGSEWSYSWDFGDGAVPRVSNQSDPTGVVYETGGTKLVTLEITNVYTGCSAVDTGSIEIWSLPVADAGPVDTTICFGTTVQLGTPAIAGYNYSWVPREGLDNPNVAQPIANPDGSKTVYHLVVTDQNGCENRDSIVVYMLDPLRVDAGPDVEICYGDTVQLSSTFDQRYQYVWEPSYNIDDTSSSDPYVWPDSSVTYVVTVIDTSVYRCGSASDEVTVVVYPLPDAEVMPEVDTIALGESTQLIATGGVQYEWSPMVGLDNGGVYNPVASPDTTTKYIVKVTDVYGCVNWDSAVVYVRVPEVWVPSAFSPNGDGLNDEVGVEGYGFVRYDFRVYDRLGGLVFRSMDPGFKWDGRNIGSGEPCPEGAYVYRFEGELSDGRKVELQGIINLIR